MIAWHHYTSHATAPPKSRTISTRATSRLCPSPIPAAVTPAEIASSCSRSTSGSILPDSPRPLPLLRRKRIGTWQKSVPGSHPPPHPPSRRGSRHHQPEPDGPRRTYGDRRLFAVPRAIRALRRRPSPTHMRGSAPKPMRPLFLATSRSRRGLISRRSAFLLAAAGRRIGIAAKSA